MRTRRRCPGRIHFLPSKELVNIAGNKAESRRGKRTKGDSEVKDEAPAEHLATGQLPLVPVGNWRPLRVLIAGDRTYASDGCDGHFDKCGCASLGRRALSGEGAAKVEGARFDDDQIGALKQ